MFTNNFIKYMTQFALGTDQSYTIANGSSKNGRKLTFVDCGFVRWMGYAMCREILASQPGSASNSMAEYTVFPGLYFGTGSTPATKSDYTLEAPITSGLGITRGQPYLSQQNGGIYTYQVNHVLANNTAVEINIYEIGLFLPIETGGTSLSSMTWHNVLMERTVLTEPITIAPGESKLVTYKITFNQTLNVE